MKKKDGQLDRIFSEYRNQYAPEIDTEKIKAQAAEKREKPRMHLLRIVAYASCAVAVTFACSFGGWLLFRQGGNKANGMDMNEDAGSSPTKIYYQSELSPFAAEANDETFAFLSKKDGLSDASVTHYIFTSGARAYSKAEYTDINGVKSTVYVEFSSDVCEIFASYKEIQDKKYIGGIIVYYDVAQADGTFASLRFFKVNGLKYYIKTVSYDKNNAEIAADNAVNLAINFNRS